MIIVINKDKSLCKVNIPEYKGDNLELIKAVVMYCCQSTDRIYYEITGILIQDGIKFSSERDIEGNYVINFH